MPIKEKVVGYEKAMMTRLAKEYGCIPVHFGRNDLMDIDVAIRKKRIKNRSKFLREIIMKEVKKIIK